MLRSLPIAPAPLRRALLGAAFMGAYLLLDWVSYIRPMQTFSVTPWNPQPALAIALLMTGGQRWLPVVWVAVIGAEFLVRGAPAPAPVTLLIATVLTLAYAAIAQALSGAFAVSARFDTHRDMLRLIGVVTTGTLAAALLYVGALFASGVGPPAYYVEAIMRFWIGDSVGVLVTLPLLLMVLDAEQRQKIGRTLRQKETLAQAAAIGLALALVFVQPAPQQFKFFYLLFVPLIWVATRAGMIGAAVAAVVIQGGVIIAVQIIGHPELQVFELQAFLLALSITGFFLGVTVEERQRAELELRESLKLAAAGEMAAALAHELNQPLTALTSYAKASQLLIDSAARNHAALAGTLQKVLSEAKRAADVVRRLRDFFRTGATQLEWTPLPTLVGRVVQALQAPAAEKNISLQMRVAAPTPELFIDHLQIEVVLRNLVVNAIDAAVDPGTVTIEIRPSDTGHVLVTVSDTGPGIAAERAAHLFEPFTTTKASGMGMGLAISRAIIEAHGGRLWAEPGNYGTLRFSLPVCEPVDD